MDCEPRCLTMASSIPLCTGLCNPALGNFMCLSFAKAKEVKPSAMHSLQTSPPAIPRCFCRDKGKELMVQYSLTCALWKHNIDIMMHAKTPPIQKPRQPVGITWIFLYTVSQYALFRKGNWLGHLTPITGFTWLSLCYLLFLWSWRKILEKFPE